jgi:hexosaminidase
MFWSALFLATSPLVPPVPEVLLFPEPKELSLGARPVSIESKSFNFVEVGASSPILARAFERYRSLIFAWDPIDGEQAPDQSYAVNIVVRNKSDVLQLSTMNEEYELTVNDTCGFINATSLWGALRAIETFSQLVLYDANTKTYSIRYTPLRIIDKPRTVWRGLMLDTSRRYYPLSYLHHTLDAMAQNKLNTFHWHATDAESAPLESVAFPNLTLYGAFAPTATYSPVDVLQLIAYAKDRGIRVVLETDMPGHSWSLGGAAPMTNCSQVSRRARFVEQLTQIYTNTDYCLSCAFLLCACAWNPNHISVGS